MAWEIMLQENNFSLCDEGIQQNNNSLQGYWMAAINMTLQGSKITQNHVWLH